jgi:hypothetical protein
MTVAQTVRRKRKMTRTTRLMVSSEKLYPLHPTDDPPCLLQSITYP